MTRTHLGGAVKYPGMSCRLQSATCLHKGTEIPENQLSVLWGSGSKLTHYLLWIRRLRGSVHSWLELKEAENAAWATPGVSSVDDKLAVVP